jgi:hypothetical protein
VQSCLVSILYSQRPRIRAVEDFKAITFPLPQNFIKCAGLDFTTLPALLLYNIVCPCFLFFRAFGQPYTLASFGSCGWLFEQLANVYGF